MPFAAALGQLDLLHTLASACFVVLAGALGTAKAAHALFVKWVERLFGGHGLLTAEAQAVLDDGRSSGAVREREEFWLTNGIQGVPAMVFNQRHLVTGAQGADNYASILTQLKQMAAEA